MRPVSVLSLAALAAVAAVAFAAKPRPVHDLAVKMKLADVASAGPQVLLSIKNQGTSPESAARVRIHAESEAGLLLWEGTIDLLPGKTGKIDTRVFLDQDTTALVAVVSPADAADEHPEDDRARAALGLKGKPAQAVVGRAIHLAHCASCHDDPAFLQGLSAAQVLAGANGIPGGPGIAFNAADAKALALYAKDPAGLVLPPPLPEPPPGGWPTWEEGVGPLLLDRCANCHGGPKAEAGVWLDAYAPAVRNASRALLAVRTGTMPQGGKDFTPAEVQLVQDWITGGKRP